MPGPGTHTTIVQRLAKSAHDRGDPATRFLADPNLNADWSTYATPDALQARFAMLGSMGPDIFFAMLDYGAGIQQLEDFVVKVLGTFRCVGQLSSRINNLIDSTLDDFSDEVWSEIQRMSALVKNIMVGGLLDLLIERNNFWHFYLPLRQVDDVQSNWYWGDFLHYVKTGCFSQKLLDNAAALQAADPDSQVAKCLGAYALGHLTHYVADTAGHAYVNRIVESPFRNHWQRHHLVENFIDAHVWATWHDAGTSPARPADENNLDMVTAQAGDPNRGSAASFVSSRLNDLCNIGSAGVDTIIDRAVSEVCGLIQKGLFDLGVSSVPTLDKPDDPAFATWTEFVADAMFQTYPPGQQHPTKLGRYPNADDVAGAYGAYRLLLSLQTEDEVEPPRIPDIAGDLSMILDDLWKKVSADLAAVPPPPAPSSSRSFSPEDLLDAVKAFADWLGDAIDAGLKALGDLVSGLINAGVAAGADVIKGTLFLFNSLLYSTYHSLRMTLVMSAYSAPLTADLTSTWGSLDLRTLWTTDSPANSATYPIEPVVAQRDLASDSTHPFSPYRPYLKPSAMPAVSVETPMTGFPAEVLAWTMPDDMLDSATPGTHDMFSTSGPAPAATEPLNNLDGILVADLETFDGSQRYFGSVMANCERALTFAVPYLTGTPYPAGVVLPDYNLDADRGYAWPTWDVDWAYGKLNMPFPWNGCDPYPSDSIARGHTLRPGLTGNDPFGNPRSGAAWVNATALSAPGSCQYGSFSFPSVVVNPKPSGGRESLADMDRCVGTDPATNEPGGGLLGPDYPLPAQRFLRSNAADPAAPHDDLVHVYLRLPYSGATTTENDGRLHDFLRAAARTANPELILGSAVNVWLGGATLALFGDPSTITSGRPDQALAVALAQLAVTGRSTFNAFVAWTPQDADLVAMYDAIFPGSPFARQDIEDAARQVLDAAYRAMWAIRANDPSWRAERAALGWIAVSGFDDTPHRPVNIPSSPYPQHDLTLTVPGAAGPVTVTTRYTIASAGGWIGPWQQNTTSFTNPDPGILGAPNGTRPSGRIPRAIPPDAPTVSATGKIIVYVHGGESRAEEAIDMANWFIIEAAQAGEEITVISFDLANSGFSSRFALTDATGTPYDFHHGSVLDFDLQCITTFIDQLDATIGNVKNRIAAVIGGSLGGNTTLLLAGRYDPNLRPYLRTIVSWSVTATAPAKYLGVLPAGDVAAYLDGVQKAATRTEGPDDHATEVEFIENIYARPLSKALGLPPQPVTWFRGGYQPGGALGWQPCKDMSITRSRFDRYETYSPFERQWTIALDLEQISFSFQDSPPMPHADVNLMLVAGELDNFFPNAIYNSTIDVARAIRDSAHGRAEFWLDTGHSIHSERPRLFVQEILAFLADPRSGNSPIGTVVTTPANASYSVVDR